MKNSIPLVVSVLLGLAAVFAVSRGMKGKSSRAEADTVSIVVAATDIDAGGEFGENNLSFVEVPVEAAPRNALRWENVSLAHGQRPQRSLQAGDQVMFSDIKPSLTLAECAREGEWTIPVTFADGSLVEMLNVDDEIAILATFDNSAKNLALETLNTTNLADIVKAAARDRLESVKVTTVLMPKVRVLGLGGRGRSFRDAGNGNGTSTIFVSLPPQQAAILVTAQQMAELHPVLRKRGDKTAMSRLDGGVVTSATFERLTKKLAPAELPEMPNK